MHTLPVLPGQLRHHCSNPNWQHWNLNSLQRCPVNQAPAPHKEWNKADDSEDRPQCLGQYYSLSRYWKIFPTKSLSLGTLSPTSHTWMSHDSTSKHFLGHFIANVNYAAEPRSYPTSFYIFEDATSLQIMLSYATSERLGILEFKVPKLAAHSHTDTFSVPTSLTPGSLRKTAIHMTLWSPQWPGPATPFWALPR